MQRVTVIAIGKLKEKYLSDAVSEYQKRLGAFCRLDICELPPCRTDDGIESGILAAIEEEADRILQKIPNHAFVIPMCIEGRQLSSEELAAVLDRSAVDGISDLCFIIGGSYGLSDRVKSAGSLRLSMSKMTFPHQLARVMLLEQLYRAYSITAGKRYHK